MMDDGELIQALGHREQLLDTLIREDVTAIDEVQARVLTAAGYEVLEDEVDDDDE